MNIFLNFQKTDYAEETVDRDRSLLSDFKTIRKPVRRGFSAMRGKKSYDEDMFLDEESMETTKNKKGSSHPTPGNNYVSKRPFSAMRGKKDNWLNSDQSKRGFSAMRGKKDSDIFSNYFSTKRGFSAMRGKKDSSERDLLAFQKRFNALRGKRTMALLQDPISSFQPIDSRIPSWMQSLAEDSDLVHTRRKRNTPTRRSFNALRGKKSFRDGLSPFLDMQLRDSLFQALKEALFHSSALRNSQGPQVTKKRPSFVPLRGKKLAEQDPTGAIFAIEQWLADNDDLDDFDNLSNEEDDYVLDDNVLDQDYVYKRRAPTNRPIGFVHMRGKRSILV